MSNQRQRQPVNVELLERSLNKMRGEMTIDMANHLIRFIAEWQSRTFEPLAEAVDAHLEWHALPWYKRIFNREYMVVIPKDEPEEPTEDAAESVETDDEPEPDISPSDPA